MGRFLTHFGTPDADIFEGKRLKINIWPTTGPNHSIFCNDVYLLHGPREPKNHPVWCSGWSGVKDCMPKVGFTPQQIKHARRNWQAPNFTSMDRARIHISYHVNFGACQSRRPCSIHILKTPFFLAQSAPLEKWAKMGYLANYCSVLPHFCCNDIL